MCVFGSFLTRVRASTEVLTKVGAGKTARSVGCPICGMSLTFAQDYVVEQRCIVKMEKLVDRSRLLVR